MRGLQHTYPFGSETVVNVVIKSFIAANGKIVQRTVRQLGFVDGKIVHNPTCPFGVVYTDRELSLLKTLASKVIECELHSSPESHSGAKRVPDKSSARIRAGSTLRIRN